MPEPINDNNQPIDDNISNGTFERSKNILQALFKIIYALNGGGGLNTLPEEIKNIIRDKDDFNDDPRLSFNIIKALDAIAVSIYLKQNSADDKQGSTK